MKDHCLLTTDHLYCICSLADVDAEIIARGTVGFSGADLENLVNQAALKAAVDEKEMVTMKDLEFAKDKILMGDQTHASQRSKECQQMITQMGF